MPLAWKVLPADPPRARALAAACGIQAPTAQVLLNRGVTSPAEVRRFLRPSLQALDDPARLPDMARGITRLRRAIARREPILIFGDSDVDGLTASVILFEALRSLGASVRATQSNRIAGGYGLPRALTEQICRSDTALLILVDCGTNQPEDIRRLAAHGIDTIIVDHHVPLDGWAEPHALINPHRTDDPGRPRPSSFGTPVAHPASGWVPGLGRELCSAGLAFKIVQALFGDGAEERLEACLDLAALGTLADCSRLIGDNRVIVANGLARIVDSRRRGLQRLCEATRTSSPQPNAIAARLLPRLNASGRLGDASAAWRLLLGEDEAQVEEGLAATEAAHATTKQLYRQCIAEAEEQVGRIHFKDQFVMVVSRSGWHPGLMGPLASQLTQRYGRPAIAIAMAEASGTGSGRSIPLFNLLQALQGCQELLVRFGGHAQACGLTVDRKQLEPFRALVNQQARQTLGQEGWTRARTVDLELPLRDVQPDWVAELSQLAPFGYGNPRPTIVLRQVAIEPTSPRIARLSDGAVSVAAKGRFPELREGERYDVVATPTVAEGAVALTVSDVKGAAAPSEPSRTSGTPYRRGPA